MSDQPSQPRPNYTALTQEEVAHRFLYHPPSDPSVAENHAAVRDTLAYAARNLLIICREYDRPRELALAITHLEEAMFWANGAIARSELNQPKVED